eukprot:CAMPEP_0197185630 /NCGR_PEP_ID=MMETSP1423-20130617/12328_1 /TAXON_ID=476441 /ORGANISM="Pseudo-nitzschia heimii, Strain UNC1101" /LENGTH=381 /DNA_ID=CAMNT_0042636745 /DNA_START=321 /DNA_END=1466 /DNA_ORIENTATION=+
MAQSLSTSKSALPTAVSSHNSISCVHVESQTTISARHLSRLRRMINVEVTNRSGSSDQKALSNSDPKFHKQVWRERVAQWCYDVLDYLEEPRDIAAVAMNIIDRYLAVLSTESSPTTPVIIGEFDYEVISFTALFLAIRVSGSNKELEISELLQMSSNPGVPEPRHIVSAGNSMLAKLCWNNQILTPNSFLRELVALLVAEHENEEVRLMNGDTLSNLIDFASYLVEVSVCDVYFSSVAPSKVAFGALALAMMCNSGLSSANSRFKGFLSHFFEIVQEQTSMNIDCPEMNSILSQLFHVYNQSQEAVVKNIGWESIHWERTMNIGIYPGTLPHIIYDEESHSPDRWRCSSKKSEELVDHNICHHVNTNEGRPVSPLQYDFL